MFIDGSWNFDRDICAQLRARWQFYDTLPKMNSYMLLTWFFSRILSVKLIETKSFQIRCIKTTIILHLEGIVISLLYCIWVDLDDMMNSADSWSLLSLGPFFEKSLNTSKVFQRSSNTWFFHTIVDHDHGTHDNPTLLRFKLVFPVLT